MPSAVYTVAYLLAKTTTSNSSSAGSIVFLLVIVALFFLMYRVFMKPRQRAAQMQRDTIQTLEPGDEVVTGAGIIGTIQHISGDRVTLWTGTGHTVTVLRRTVARKVEGDEFDQDHDDEHSDSHTWDEDDETEDRDHGELEHGELEEDGDEPGEVEADGPGGPVDSDGHTEQLIERDPGDGIGSHTGDTEDTGTSTAGSDLGTGTIGTDPGTGTIGTDSGTGTIGTDSGTGTIGSDASSNGTVDPTVGGRIGPRASSDPEGEHQ